MIEKIRNILLYKLHLASNEIFAIKQSHPNGISPKDSDWKRYQEAKREASLYLTGIKILKLCNGNVPSKKEFAKLLRAQRTQIDLSALQAAAQNGGNIALCFRRPPLFTHCPRGGERAFAMKAWKLLHKIENRLEKNPSYYAEAGRWAEQREAEMLERRVAAHA